MKKFKDRWEIESDWQLIFPFLGFLGLLFSGYLIGKKIVTSIGIEKPDIAYIGLTSATTIFFTIFFLFITLKLFSVLAPKWKVTYRWELIAIFIAFAVTGSTAAKVSDPIISFLGFQKETTSAFLYWPLRLFLIFPVYQVLLLIFGWLFGQFKFFWAFEKKMLKRMGFAPLFKD